MLQKNCRIEKLNNLKFYEKDVLFDDYIFTQNLEVEVDATYITPGFGLVLIDSTEGASLDANPSCYLFKIGYREASVFYSSSSGLQIVDQISCSDAVTIQEHMKFKLKKYGKKISIYLNDKLVIEEIIKKSLDKFCIGYYSNVGNTINNINIAANIPDKWIVNMKNTKGGYIRFLEDSFELCDCTNNAEIEQVNIKLKAGTYYLSNKLSKVNDKCDIRCYIYKSDDNRYYDQKKNMLNKNNSFTLYEETEVNFKITGKNGRISEIILSDEENADYIPTSMNSVDFDGSYIEILLNNLSKVKWKGIVSKTPYKKTGENVPDYFLIRDSITEIKPEHSNILLNKEYDYEFNFKTCEFLISSNNEEVYSCKLVNLSDRITIFKNLSAIISQLTLYTKNNDPIDVVTQDQDINFVNANISSPIIVVDEYKLPLDLSSSYRLCHYKNYDKYIFTNWEREYFLPDKTIRLEKQVINKCDSIIIYGIKKNAKYDFKKFFDVNEDNINSIDNFTKDYKLIKEKDLLLFDKNKSILYLKPDDIDKYEMFVIDYLKNDSYCINFNYLKNNYEIDISSNRKTKVLYDSLSITSEEKNITQVNNYMITNINGNMLGYIVLTQGDE